MIGVNNRLNFKSPKINVSQTYQNKAKLNPQRADLIMRSTKYQRVAARGKGLTGLFLSNVNSSPKLLQSPNRAHMKQDRGIGDFNSGSITLMEDSIQLKTIQYDQSRENMNVLH